MGIVDDDPSIRSSLARVLRLHGIHAETFASAEEFLERLPRGAPRFLVLDVHLGGRSGFELQDQLVSQGAAPPIVFITAHESIPAARLEPATGALGFLRKPFDAAALLALVIPHLGDDAPGEADE